MCFASDLQKSNRCIKHGFTAFWDSGWGAEAERGVLDVALLVTNSTLAEQAVWRGSPRHRL